MHQILKYLGALILFGIFTVSGFAVDDEITGGNWVEKGYSIKGGWKIVERDERKFIVFDDNFKTKKGPDLKVYLSAKSIEAVKGGNVAQSSIKIAPLKSNKGAQEYEIPNEVKLEDYSSLLIHCEAYSHLWGGAALRD